MTDNVVNLSNYNFNLYEIVFTYKEPVQGVVRVAAKDEDAARAQAAALLRDLQEVELDEVTLSDQGNMPAPAGIQ